MKTVNELSNTAEKLQVVNAMAGTLLEFLSAGEMDDVTVVISGHGKLRLMTTLTARECLDVLSEAADRLIEKGGV
jgi:hypothetical protein